MRCRMTSGPTSGLRSYLLSLTSARGGVKDLMSTLSTKGGDGQQGDLEKPADLPVR